MTYLRVLFLVCLPVFASETCFLETVEPRVRFDVRAGKQAKGPAVVFEGPFVRTSRVRRGQQTVVVRDYQVPFQHDVELRGYQVLAKVVGDRQDTFAVPRIISSTSKTIELSNVQGHPLTRVLDEVHPDLRNRILADYHQRLSALEGLVKDRLPGAKKSVTAVPGQPRRVSYFFGPFGQTKLELNISIDKCLIHFDPDETEKFTLSLVEPY
ncbi:MAG: hypothetical protein HY537_00200 [Deltaproteobacteria bacterium]|nr:hypothetical protein [Deltaproteobacteria bacterium]